MFHNYIFYIFISWYLLHIIQSYTGKIKLIITAVIVVCYCRVQQQT